MTDITTILSKIEAIALLHEACLRLVVLGAPFKLLKPSMTIANERPIFSSQVSVGSWAG